MNHEAARATVQELEALGVSASSIVVDVGNEKLNREMFQKVADQFGRLDVFVANAARATFRPVAELNARNWRRVMELNSEAFLFGAQEAAKLMKQSGGGRIVGISSLGATRYIPEYAALGAAKATMECLARYLAVELAPHGINVNVVSGGFINTETMQRIPHYKELTQHLVARTPAGRLGKEEDLAGVVAFLCSPDANWIRGQTLIADGGFSLLS